MVKSRTLPPKYTTGFLQNVDTRTTLFKRLETTYNELCQDCGGWSRMPLTHRALAERFAYLLEFTRKIELKLVDDPTAESDLLGKWIQSVNSMMGLSRMLGQDKKADQDWIDGALYGDEPEPKPKKRKKRKRPRVTIDIPKETKS
jgi:hypothetical protein